MHSYDTTISQVDCRGERLVFGPWNLGRWDLLINVFGTCYASLLVPFMALFTILPSTATTMNHMGPVFGLVLLLAVFD